MQSQAAKLAYREAGTQQRPLVLLWHGGAGPEQTWSKQWVLVDRWHIVVPWRRGFGPSPPCVRQDWEEDAADLLRLAPAGAHLVAHSYGGVSAAVAATLDPQRFGSLTLIEAPLWLVDETDPGVRKLAELARAVSSSGADPSARQRFRQLAALPSGHAETARIEQRAIGFRDPAEARPDLTRLRSARLACFVVSGGHHTALEHLCDALAQALDARRSVLPGCGHAVQRVPTFNEHLEAFLGDQP